MPPPPRSPVWLFPLLAACGSPNLPSGTIECGPEGSCPRDMACGDDGLCRSGSGGGSDAGPGGADGGGGDGGAACPGGRLEDFADDFDDLAAWRVVGGGLDTCSVEAADGVLTIHTAEAGTCGVESLALFDFIDQSAAIRIADDNLNMGNPDLVFRAVIAGRTLQMVWFDGAMSAMTCPDTGGCGTSGIPGGLRDWWRLRHDPVESTVVAELSSTGVGYVDGVPLDVAGDDPTCVRLFIGSTGQLTGDLMYPILIDRLNIP